MNEDFKRDLTLFLRYLEDEPDLSVKDRYELAINYAGIQSEQAAHMNMTSTLMNIQYSLTALNSTLSYLTRNDYDSPISNITRAIQSISLTLGTTKT